MLSLTTQAKTLREKIELHGKNYRTAYKEFPKCSDPYKLYKIKYQFSEQFTRCMNRIATRTNNNDEHYQFTTCKKKYHDRFEKLEQNIIQELNALPYYFFSLVNQFKYELQKTRLLKEAEKVQKQKETLGDIHYIAEKHFAKEE